MSTPQTLLFVLPHLRAGGIEFVVRELANRLDRSRWRPVLCLSSATGDLLDGVASDVAIIDNDGSCALGMIPRLPRIIRRERAALVYVGTNAMNIAVLAAVKSMPRSDRPKLIVTEHTSAGPYLEKSRFQGLRRGLVSWLYPGADLLAFPMAALAEEWRKVIRSDRLETAVLPNPVLDRDVIARIRAAVPMPAPLRVVAAGRLIPDKGHAVLIRAIAQLHDPLPAITLDIFGSGKEDAALQQLIRALGLETSVRLRGYTDDLLDEFARADVVALPSLREGFGNVLIEALAMGARVVASDCHGPRAILKDGALGSLVPPGDADAFARALKETLMSSRKAMRDDTVEFSLGPYYKDTAVATFDRIARMICPAGT